MMLLWKSQIHGWFLVTIRANFSQCSEARCDSDSFPSLQTSLHHDCYAVLWNISKLGLHFNIKNIFPDVGIPIIKLYYGNSYSGKMASLYWNSPWRSISLTIFSSHSKRDEISQHYSLKGIDLIRTKLCTYQDSTSVLVCAQFCSDQTNIRGNRKKWIIVKFEISLMGWVPGSILSSLILCLCRHEIRWLILTPSGQVNMWFTNKIVSFISDIVCLFIVIIWFNKSALVQVMTITSLRLVDTNNHDWISTS